MPARKDECDTYGNSISTIAVCPCGHAALIPRSSAPNGSYDYLELAAMRPKLRCGKCGRRSPKLEMCRRSTA
jgi:hypothetical protein